LPILSGSISEALAKSMTEKFHYKQIDSTKVEQSFQRVLEARKKAITKNKIKPGETGVEFLPMRLSELSAITKHSKIDLLVFGQYEPVGNYVPLLLSY